MLCLLLLRLLSLGGGDSHIKSDGGVLSEIFKQILKGIGNVLKKVHLKFNLAPKWIAR